MDPGLKRFEKTFSPSSDVLSNASPNGIGSIEPKGTSSEAGKDPVGIESRSTVISDSQRERIRISPTANFDDVESPRQNSNSNSVPRTRVSGEPFGEESTKRSDVWHAKRALQLPQRPFQKPP